jgi:hypothetical protein
MIGSVRREQDTQREYDQYGEKHFPQGWFGREAKQG